MESCVNRFSRQLLDDFDLFVAEILSNPEKAEVFYKIISPSDMVRFTQSCGISVGADEFSELLSGDTGRRWFFGSTIKDPIAHMQRVFRI
jgi:hypothetical protein